MHAGNTFGRAATPGPGVSWLWSLCVVAWMFPGICGLAETGDWQRSASDARARSLLARMSLEEKIGQMMQVDMNALRDKADIKNYSLGSVSSGRDSGPADLTARGWARAVEEAQGWAFRTPLKIPLLYGIDAAHGHSKVNGAVIFPHNIGMGATRNPQLVERAAQVTAREVAATGIRWTFAPCVAAAQNPRWGRTYESFGSAPELAGLMGPAVVRGFQGRAALDSDSVLACAKHFLGEGSTGEGADGGNLVCDEATLRRVHLPGYEAAIKAGVGSIMVSAGSWNGTKMQGNKHLLTEVLKGGLDFQGILISDWGAIDQLAGDYQADIETGVNAGLDMVMLPAGPGEKNNYQDFARLLKELVAEKRVPEARVDDAVRRILRVKFQLGLFEEPFADSRLTAEVGSKEHRAVARECVRESLVLLKSANGLLPLPKGINRLLVAGRAADDLGRQCGGWALDGRGRSGEANAGGTTILRAIRNAVGPGTQVVFAPEGNEAASADAAVVVVGEVPHAEGSADWSEPRLAAEDAALIERIKARGIPVITVLLSGRPLILGPVLEASDALVAAWLPGTEGQGVADVLFGDYKPTGKLPCAWPASVSEFTVPPGTGAGSGSLFPYGFGLTYGRLASASRTRAMEAGGTGKTGGR